MCSFVVEPKKSCKVSSWACLKIAFGMFHLSTPCTLAITMFLELNYDDANVHTISLTMTNLDILGPTKIVDMHAFILCDTSYFAFVAPKLVR
jgi:hypothetical protein